MHSRARRAVGWPAPRRHRRARSTCRCEAARPTHHATPSLGHDHRPTKAATARTSTASTARSLARTRSIKAAALEPPPHPHRRHVHARRPILHP
eukprot:350105-Chlamydomonas_euryale.AAC.3